MAAAIPAGIVKVAESGVRDAADAARLADAGYDAILVGETLVTAAPPRSASPAEVVRPAAASRHSAAANTRGRRGCMGTWGSTDDDDDPGLPLKLWPCSNGEYLPPPLDELRAEAMRRARAARDHHARRHGWSRRRFLLSSAGMASGLAALQACSDERSASETEHRARRPVHRAGDAPPPIPEEATTTVHGEPDAGVVVDVQTHFLESGEWGTGFPQGACGEAEPIDCFSAEYWRDLVLAGSATRRWRSSRPSPWSATPTRCRSTPWSAAAPSPPSCAATAAS